MVNMGAMLLMIVITLCSQSLKRRQKTHFVLVFVSIILIISAQLVTAFLSGMPRVWRPLNLISYCIGYLLTPMIPLMFSGAISDGRRTRFLFTVFGIYAGLFLVLLSQGCIFTVDSSNHFQRAPGHWFYVAAFCLSVAYLIRDTVLLCLAHQGSSRIVIFLLVFYVAFSTLIQFLIPHSFVTWSYVTFSAILFYIYCNELWVQVDGLTRLLNHGTYLRRVHDLSPGSTLILFDVDCFKQVNDTYGHLFGDQCLCTVARTIHTVYGSGGRCYRVGGDEFAVIVRKKNFRPEEKQARFDQLLQEIRAGLPGMPDVSLGWAVYEKGQSVKAFINEADKQLYAQKALRHCKD